MYDQEEISPLRRILWVLVTFVIIFSVLWGIVWVLFLRHSTPVAKQPQQNKSTSSGSTHAKQKQPSQPSSSSTSGSSSSGTNNSSNGSSAQTTTQQPTQLANTGAGDVVSLFAGVTIVSGVAYQIRLRKKLLA